MIWTPILGIALLVMVARGFGFARQARLADAAEAGRIAAEALPGFRPAEVALAADARGALVAAGDGRVALVAPLGDRWVVRLANGAATEVAGDTLTLRLREFLFPATRLELGPAAALWAQRL